MKTCRSSPSPVEANSRASDSSAVSSSSSTISSSESIMKADTSNSSNYGSLTGKDGVFEAKSGRSTTVLASPSLLETHLLDMVGSPSSSSCVPRKISNLFSPLLRGVMSSSCSNAKRIATAVVDDVLRPPCAPIIPSQSAKKGTEPSIISSFIATPSAAENSAAPITKSPFAPLSASVQNMGISVEPMIVYSALGKLLETARQCALPPSRKEPKSGAKDYPTVMLALSKCLPFHMQRPTWCLADYVVTEKLYKGYASTVFKALCKTSGTVVVLKVYTLAAVCDLYKFQIYREVFLHSSIQHENVVAMHAAFQEGDNVVMVQEYADGADLFSVTKKYGGRLSERLAVQMVLDPFLRVLHHLHSKGIIHRDIKPENILFTKNMSLKLGDFGLAIDLKEEKAVTRAGTLDYMAPEVLQCPYKSRPDENKGNDQLHYNGGVDSWAVGVLAFELIMGYPPFYHQTREGTEDLIKTSQPMFASSVSEEARDFILTTLNKDPEQRPCILKMLRHPWIDSSRTRRSLNHREGSSSSNMISLEAAVAAAVTSNTPQLNTFQGQPGAAGSKPGAVTLVQHSTETTKLPDSLNRSPASLNMKSSFVPLMPPRLAAILANINSKTGGPMSPAAPLKSVKMASKLMSAAPTSRAAATAGPPGPPSRSMLQEMHRQINQRMEKHQQMKQQQQQQSNSDPNPATATSVQITAQPDSHSVSEMDITGTEGPGSPNTRLAAELVKQHPTSDCSVICSVEGSKQQQSYVKPAAAAVRHLSEAHTALQM
ncbi:hypothetical protein CEUSTIGMA_g10871.t1 [Chlamydomonas eustigma]|uniref:Protein kinase domain-containing protein n=1 Tax=Chlamydomonas eustigma TaxID=1157962 RepID=A0A250XK98_9CHLO|nr:hypothetical protein CEUSTIGMA_g10871.t1 [Chlamydomonas eustigma]|eukprot:GAX83446.1 hypothetical protein CEUSTIGMA_g10871.t1 [Chlamydomonas eustigma]